MFTNPTVADFKATFVRDFTYGTTPDTVMDSDISQGLLEASISINSCLFSSQLQYSQAYLNLAAHYMVMNLRASGTGCSGQAEWLVQSKSVGSISESFSIPQRILDNPLFAQFTKTTYGTKYLMMIYPLLSGQIFVVPGGTLA